MKVLIIGFGKMGHIYSQYLKGFDYYDPFVDGGLQNLQDLNKYSHIIISTPPENHYESYKKIIGFKGSIYIDKPIIVSENQLDIFNGNIFCGMTERYNPVVTLLKKLIIVKDMISIKFSRYSIITTNIKTPVLFDLGIHDLDLYLYLLDYDKFPSMYDIFEKSKTCYIMAKQNNILSIFEWSHESYKRERKLIVLQKNAVYEVDLIDQTIIAYKDNGIVQNLYVPKAQPLKEVMKSFLNNEQCNAKLSHEFMINVMHKERVYEI